MNTHDLLSLPVPGAIGAGRDPAPRTLLLLHGSASSSLMWKSLGRALSSIYTVAAPDLVGYGDSPAWPPGRPFSLEDEVARIRPLVEAAAPVDVVGYSYGGAVAMAMARSRPSVIRSLTLIEPVIFPALLGAGQIEHYGHLAAVYERFVRQCRSGDIDEAMREFIDYWSGQGSWSRLPGPVREAMLKAAPKIELDWSASFAGGLPSPEALGALGRRTLLVRGDDSPGQMRALVDSLHALMPGSALRVITDANHLLPVTHPVQLLQHLLWHLSRTATNDNWLPPAGKCAAGSDHDFAPATPDCRAGECEACH